jgi:hypothetical protein
VLKRLPQLWGTIEVEKALRLKERGIKWVKNWSEGETHRIGNVVFSHGLYVSDNQPRRHLQVYSQLCAVAAQASSFKAAIERGTYKFIRTDGTETVHQGKASFDEIQRIIGCDCLDTVTIDRKRQTVMFVDDTAMIDGKPLIRKLRRYITRSAGPERSGRFMGMS